MATEIGRGVIPVTFDRDQLGRDLHSSFDDGARKAEGGIGSTFKRLAGVASAAFAGVQVFSFVKDAFGEAREAEKVAAQTEAVIKSTGGAAGVTAEQFSKLAESISQKTGIDDEAIQSAENLLATFTNLKNGVGDGADIFNQATQAAVDMGAALGGDPSSNAIQLGKALNNPIEGISALTRVGVTFSDEQKNLIKSLQESGDMAGAQKVILAELTKEFGGSAEATATAGDKFGVFWGNLQEKIGGFLIPLMDSAAEWAMTTLPNAFGVLQDTVGPIIEDISETIGAFWSTLTTGMTENDAATGIEDFALILRDDLWPILKNIASFIKDNWKPILVVAAIALGLLTAPITTVVALLIYLYTQFPAVREGVATVVAAVQGFIDFFTTSVLPVIQTVVGYLIEQFTNLVAAVQERWATISEAITNVLTVISVIVAVALAPLILIWTQFHDQILAIVAIVWDQIKLYVETAISIVVGIIDLALALLTGDWSAAWDAIKGIVSAVWDLIKGTVENAFAILGELVSIGMQAVSGLFSLAWDGIVSLFSGAIDKIVEFFTGLPGRIGTAASDMFGFLWDSFKAVLNRIITAWNNFGLPSFTIGGWDIPGPGPDVPSFTTPAVSFPDIPLLHSGTWSVPGRPGEDMLAMLRAGETVISAQGTIGGQPVGGNTYQLSSGPVYVNEPQDIETAFARLELLAGV